MDIYLARICKRADETLYVEVKRSTTTTEPYTAISHVWGEPDSIKSVDIMGIGKVMLSPGKRKLGLLSLLCRPDVCGTGWFWLDLFCLDQRPESPIPMSTQLMSIPAIYKSATEVVILIESPVCGAWAAKAASVAEQGVADLAVFDEEEARHARRCPNLLVMDPWFQRLWTRQEGLYAMRLRTVVINTVDCQRLATSLPQWDRWLADGRASAARSAADTFIADKLAYHGIATRDSAVVAGFYHALAYRGQVSVSEAPFAGCVGPATSYSPIGEAWRSGRTTTKLRDYVLAVFPDVEGYNAPQNAKQMTFKELFRDACEQVGGKGPERGFHVLTKVAESMVTGPESGVHGDGGGGHRPWVLDEPGNVTEAYDSILGVVSSRPVVPAALSTGGETSMDGRERHLLSLRPLDLDCTAPGIRSTIEELVKLCDAGTDLVQQMILAAPLGPCVGSDRALSTHEKLFHRFIAHQFSVPALQQYYSSEQTVATKTKSFDRLRPHGVVNLEKIQLPENILEQELRLFLVCLMCGLTLTCAAKILRHVELAVVTADCISGTGEILAIVNKRVLKAPERYNLVLRGNGFEDFQGLAVISSGSAGRPNTVVGRTMIPRFLS